MRVTMTEQISVIVANRLIMIREGINAACLACQIRSDTGTDASALAASNSLRLSEYPPAAPVIEGGTDPLCWAFAESVLDVTGAVCMAGRCRL